MPLSRALLVVLLAMGIGRMSMVPVELAIQGVLEIWPGAFDGIAVYSASGKIDLGRTQQLGYSIKEILYSLVAIAICLVIKRNIELTPAFGRRFFLHLGMAAIAATAVGLAVRLGASFFDSTGSYSALYDFKNLSAAGPILAGAFLLRVCVLAPIEEEFIYRGLVVDRASPAPLGALAALAIVPWALDHVTTGGIWQVTVTLIVGPVYFWLRLKTGHFGYSAIAHAIFNAIQAWP